MKVVWIDTETGGTDSQKHGLIQLAYLVEIDGQIVADGVLFSNCENKSYTTQALKVNRFTLEQIKSFPPPSDMYQKLKSVFAKFVNPYDKNRDSKFIFGGYNAGFDFEFVRQLWIDNHDMFLFSFFNHGFLDPAVLARFLQYAGYSIPGNIKLFELAKFLEVKSEGELHDAKTDILLTRAIALKMISIFKNYGINN